VPRREPVSARALARKASSDPARRTHRAPTYWVQVGAFRTADAAVALVDRLGNEDIAIVTEPPAADRRASEPLFRVRVGPYPDHARAAAKSRELSRGGFDSFVVPDK
jgi:cell division septation protein DedD